MTQTTTRVTCQRSRRGVLLAIVALGLSFPAAQANTRTQADLAEIAATNLAVPLVVKSTQNDDRLSGTVNGTLNVPFGRVRAALQRPRHWCELMTLHLNVKSCTHAPVDDGSVMNVYTGRKEFERPEDAERIDMRFKLRENSPLRLRVQLTAATGPMGTFDYHVAAVFSPADATTTLVRFEYRYGLGFRAQLAIGAYLATVASDKVGFTRTGHDTAGDLVLCGWRDGVTPITFAILTRRPLELVRAGALPGLAAREPRGALWVETIVAGQAIQLINTHLGRSQHERRLQIDALMGPEWFGRAERRGPVAILGDFNAGQRSYTYRRLTRRCTDVQLHPSARAPRNTWFSGNALRRIDHIVVTPGLEIRAVDVPQTRRAGIASDHLPVVCDVRLAERPQS